MCVSSEDGIDGRHNMWNISFMSTCSYESFSKPKENNEFDMHRNVINVTLFLLRMRIAPIS